MAITKVNRIELEGSYITIYRDWKAHEYGPSTEWVDKVCELASKLVNEGKATVELSTAGWMVDLVEEPVIEDA